MQFNYSKLRGKNYQTETVKKLITRLSHTLFPDAQILHESEKIIEQLKEKFEQTTSRDMKNKILSIIAKNWSFPKYREVFGETVSKRIVSQTKKLVEKNGILCDNTKKIGSKSIDQNTIDKAHEFYRSDNVSRACPGIRDYVIRKSDGEAFQLFKNDNPGLKIGFSKFASIRPKECVLASSTHGIHQTCVCVYHQNAKLIFDSLVSHLDLKKYNIETLRQMMDILLCETATEKCRLNECKHCPGIDGKDGKSGLRSILFQIIDETIFEKISFKQWINTGCEYTLRITPKQLFIAASSSVLKRLCFAFLLLTGGMHLERVTRPVYEFTDIFCKQLKNFNSHDYISKKQSNFFKHKKEHLSENEMIVLMDFSENLAFEIQDAAQAYHYAKDQCTIHPICLYYKENGDLKHQSIIIIAES